MAEINGAHGELLYGKVLTPDGITEQGVIAVADGLIQYAGEASWLPAAYELADSHPGAARSADPRIRRCACARRSRT